MSTTKRPTLGTPNASDAVNELVRGLQDAIDRGDADLFNRQFAADVLWGSPFGAVVDGYDTIHAIHTKMFGSVPASPGASRYVVEHSRFPTDDVAIAYVRRLAANKPITSEPAPGKPGAFDELALFVLVKRDGAWWLAAGQHVPDRRDVYGPARD